MHPVDRHGTPPPDMAGCDGCGSTSHRRVEAWTGGGLRWWSHSWRSAPGAGTPRRQAPATRRSAAVQRLDREQEDVHILDRGADSLEYTYRSNEGNARHSFMRWLDLDQSGQADVEIVVHGRERDVAGARDLIRRVAEGMRGATGGVVEVP